MTKDVVLAVVGKYELALAARFHVDGVSGCPRDKLSDFSCFNQMSHVMSMLPKIRQFVADDRLDKAFRWLGFVQGVLWAAGVYTIDQMRLDNLGGGDPTEPERE